MSRSHLESEAELRFLQSRVAGKQWGPEQEKRLKLSLGPRLLNFVAFNPCAKHLGLEKTDSHTGGGSSRHFFELCGEAPSVWASTTLPDCLGDSLWEQRRLLQGL